MERTPLTVQAVHRAVEPVLNLIPVFGLPGAGDLALQPAEMESNKEQEV